jgi:hypothetical protein
MPGRQQQLDTWDDLHNGGSPLYINYPMFPTVADVPGILKIKVKV